MKPLLQQLFIPDLILIYCTENIPNEQFIWNDLSWRCSKNYLSLCGSVLHITPCSAVSDEPFCEWLTNTFNCSLFILLYVPCKTFFFYAYSYTCTLCFIKSIKHLALYFVSLITAIRCCLCFSCEICFGQLFLTVYITTPVQRCTQKCWWYSEQDEPVVPKLEFLLCCGFIFEIYLTSSLHRGISRSSLWCLWFLSSFLCLNVKRL